MRSGEEVSLQRTCPSALEERAIADMQRGELEQWASAKDDRAVLKPQPYLQPLRELISTRLTEEWTAQHRHIARAIVAGAYPSQPELFARGRVDSDLCPRCREQPGTLLHCWWKCQEPAIAKLREELAMQHRAADFLQPAATARDHWLWTRD